ncbi:MAG: hypothetical protein GY753_09655 [Gammaproteobacteria bacterium]|nr:hypothetical protein [Gammaproteobacteria bacterium]
MRFTKEIDGDTYKRWRCGDYMIAFYHYQQSERSSYRINPGFKAYHLGAVLCTRVSSRDVARQVCIKHQREISNG